MISVVGNIISYGKLKLDWLPDGRVEYLVKRGEHIAPGDKIFVTRYREIKESYYLPRLLKIRKSDANKYVLRLPGEHVQSGEVLAQKDTAFGLGILVVDARGSGIVSLDRINDGFVDVVGEEYITEVVSSMHAEILDVSATKGISLVTNAIGVPYSANGKLGETGDPASSFLLGELVFVRDGASVYSQADLGDDYSNQIVYVGSFVYPELLQALYEKRAKAVIVGSTDFETVQNAKLPVIVLDGFGHTQINRSKVDYLRQHTHYIVAVRKKVSLMHGRTIYLLSPGKPLMDMATMQYPQFMKENSISRPYYLSQIDPGTRVRSIDGENYGLMGVVEEVVQDTPYIRVRTDSGSEVLLHTGGVVVLQ